MFCPGLVEFVGKSVPLSQHKHHGGARCCSRIYGRHQKIANVAYIAFDFGERSQKYDGIAFALRQLAATVLFSELADEGWVAVEVSRLAPMQASIASGDFWIRSGTFAPIYGPFCALPLITYHDD